MAISLREEGLDGINSSFMGIGQREQVVLKVLFFRNANSKLVLNLLIKISKDPVELTL